MSKDPFLEFYKKMQDASKEVFDKNTSFFIARIKSPLPNLEIQLDDIVLDKDDILINSNLIKLHNASITCSNGAIEHNLVDELNIGDKVVLLKINGIFILISKVVSI